MPVVLEETVERVIESMRENLGEPLTVDDLARTAMFSKFHFTRVFQRITGLSPGRFLSAMRLQRAKELLVSTSLHVADISAQVGYSSVGTFSSRFTRSVGLSPTSYRRLGGFAPEIAVEGRAERPGPSRAFLRGRILAPETGRHGVVFLGLFADRIPEGRPARCAILTGPGRYHLDSVPHGTWYLLAHSIAGDPETLTQPSFALDDSLSVGTVGPITIDGDSTVTVIDIPLRTMRALDPPILTALLDVRRLVLGQGGADGPPVMDNRPTTALSRLTYRRTAA